MGRSKRADSPVRDVPGSSKDETLASRMLRFVAHRLSPQGRPEGTERLEKSLHAFVKEAWHVVEPQNPFIDSWHVGCVCEHLQALTDLEIQRLVMNMPPRHGKSLLCSVFWPAWVWATQPHTRWLFGSYGEALSTEHSMKTRDVIQSPWYQARWGGVFSLKGDQNVKSYFANDRQGYRIATTVDGKGLGLGGDYVVADDPHKQSEIHSEAKRQAVLNWWTKTMSTRGDRFHKTRFLIVMQRLREDDLSGYMKQAGLGYEALVMPAEHEPGRIVYSLPAPTPLPRDAILPTTKQRQRPELMDPRTEAGELLAPEMFDRAAIETLKATLLNDAPGQLQQRPSAEAGTVYQRARFRYFGTEMRRGVPYVVLGDEGDPLAIRWPISALRFFQTIDTASTANETSAYTAVATFALTPRYQLLVWNVWRERLQVPEIMPCLRACATGPIRLLRLDGGLSDPVPDGAPWPQELLYQAVESKSSGIGLIQLAAVEGRPFQVLKADGSKVARSASAATMYHNGMVYHMRGAPWLVQFEDEILSFPNGRFADCADVLAYGGIRATFDRFLRSSVERDIIADGGGGPPPLLDTDGDGRTFRYGHGEDTVEVMFDDD